MRSNVFSLGFLLVAAAPGAAQRIDGVRAGVTAVDSSGRGNSTLRLQSKGAGSLTATSDQGSRSAWQLAPIASAILPGAGQFVLRNDRFVAYLAVEATMWALVVKDRRQQADHERSYRELARDVARANFGVAPKDTNDWSYYEHVRKYLESGAYSLSNGPIVVPETDETTYNGSMWRLAQLNNVDMASALADYDRNAVKPGFLWSWRNAQLEWDLYRRTTDRRNDAAQSVTNDLLVIGANHVLSMVDAFATVRLRVRPHFDGGYDVSARIPVGRK